MSLRARYRWAVLAVTIVAFMQTHLHRLGFASLIPVFVADMGLSYAAAGTIQTAYFWTYALAQVPVGLLTDRWGARRVMLICTSLLALGGLAFAASGTYAALLLSRMVVGLGAAAVWVPGMLLIAQWFPSAERGRAAGLMSAGGGVGGTVGLVLVPVLAEALGWRVAYATTVVPSLITLALIALLIRNPRERAGRRRGNRIEDVHGRDYRPGPASRDGSVTNSAATHAAACTLAATRKAAVKLPVTSTIRPSTIGSTIAPMKHAPLVRPAAVAARSRGT